MGDEMTGLEALLERLRHVRTHARRLFFLYGIAWTLSALAAFVCASYVADRYIPDLPAAVRLVFLSAGLAAVGYAAFRHVVYPLKTKIVEDDIALALERQFPQYKDRLISVIQLSRDPGGEKFNSPVMLDALKKETLELSGRMDFHSVLMPAGAVRFFAVSVVAALAIVGYGAAYPQNARIWFNRILGGSARWPKSTFITVENFKRVVAKGDDVSIVARIGGKIPSRVQIHYTLKDTGERIERMARVPNTDQFKFDFPKIADSLDFYVTGGGDETDRFSIEALTPPAIERIRVWYKFPAYTRLKDTEASRPEEGGNVKAPLGTEVTILATANVPLEGARLHVGRRGAEQTFPAAVTKDESGTPAVRCSLVVQGDSEYSIGLRAVNTLENRDPIRYDIRALIDAAPVLKVIEPGADKLVTVRAVMPIVVVASDDYGLSRLEMVYKFLNKEGPEMAVQLVQGLDETTQKKAQSDYRFEIAGVGAKEGDVIVYFFRAADNNLVPGPNVTTSRPFHFTVVAQNELEQRLEEKIMSLKGDLEGHAKRQDEIKNSTQKLTDDMKNKNAIEKAERDGIMKSANEQKQLTQKLERAAREVDDVLKDVRNNNLWDVQTAEKIEASRNELAEASAASSPQAATLLSQAANIPDAGERDARFKDAQKMEQLTSDGIARALDKIKEWEDYQTVVRIVREIIEIQRKARTNLGGGTTPK
jgi:hypothetical protein